ncbi:MAG: shikimate kinase [Bacteroidetes bacterium]|nr:shikimate kinase [Bacteroidota bacterium]MBU1718105.1 shikimate kinase [Bacteroidota bacterium]
MRIYLVGYMGCGKTTLGKRLASRLGFQFVDTDLMFEEKYHMSIVNFFSFFGEIMFRDLEKEILRSTSQFENTVVSTGGGTPVLPGNMEFIRKNGISCYLKMPPAALLSRLTSSKKKRPLIKEMNRDTLLHMIEKHLTERESRYLMADYSVEGLSLQLDELTKLIKADPRFAPTL